MSGMNCNRARALSCTVAVSICVALTSPALSQTPPASFDAAGKTTVLSAHGVGAQIYECKAAPTGGNAWTFREPVASLIADGVTLGRHYAGPSWELASGGSIKGKQAATAPGATAADIPLLKLDVIEHHGDGPLSAATLVLRLNTKGGALSGACDSAGELRSVPYSADYLFLR